MYSGVMKLYLELGEREQDSEGFLQSYAKSEIR